MLYNPKECRGKKKFVLSSSLRIPDPCLLGDPQTSYQPYLGTDSLKGNAQNPETNGGADGQSSQALMRLSNCGRGGGNAHHVPRGPGWKACAPALQGPHGSGKNGLRKHRYGHMQESWAPGREKGLC